MKRQISPLETAGEILIIIAAAFWCISFIGMAWGIPMIINSINRLNGTKSNTVAHGIISILFFGLIGGVLTIVGSTSSEDKGQVSNIKNNLNEVRVQAIYKSAYEAEIKRLETKNKKK